MDNNSGVTTDMDDDLPPEEELFNVVRSHDDENEKVASLNRLLVRNRDLDFNEGHGKHGNTALHVAAIRNEGHVAKWLIDHDAKTDIKNDAGFTPLEIAKSHGHQNIVAILEGKVETNESHFSSLKRKRTLSEDSSDEDETVKKAKPYGTKRTLHGVAYQLKLLILFFKRAMDENYEFRLATEIKDAGKLDDIVFKYRPLEGGKEVIRFLQAKHKLEYGKITLKNILSRKQDVSKIEGTFGIYKYFSSYQTIKRHFTNAQLQDFIICTNLDVDETIRNCTEKIECDDKILRYNDKTCERLRFKPSEDLISKLKTGEVYSLAKKVAECAFHKKVMDLRNPLLNTYHIALSEKVIEAGNYEEGSKKKFGVFRKDFLDGTVADVLGFRRIFREIYMELSKTSQTEEDFWHSMQNKRLQISKKFGSTTEAETVPEPLPVEATDSEVREFLDKFVLAVNQPSEDRLGEMMESELGQHRDINLIKCDIVADKIQKHMFDWMKQKDSKYISKEDGEALFKLIKDNFRDYALMGPLLSYRADETFNVIEIPGLLDFFDSKEKQIFHLTTPLKTTFSAIKLCQTLEKHFPKYKADNSHIFVPLSTILRLKDQVLKAFRSKKDLMMIIEIDVRAACHDVEALLSELHGVLRSQDNKLIVVGLDCDELRPKLEQIFGDNRLKKAEDKWNGFSDLRPDFRYKLLDDATVLFQGEETTLGKLLDNDSRDRLLKGELLLKIISHERVEIGQPIRDAKYEEAEKHLVKRTFYRHREIHRSIEADESFYILWCEPCCIAIERTLSENIIFINKDPGPFASLSNVFPTRNIHWLCNNKYGKLVWLDSHGDQSKLLRYAVKDEPPKHKHKQELTFNHMTGKVIIIADEPGMGKSIILTHIALQLKELQSDKYEDAISMKRRYSESEIFNLDQNLAIQEIHLLWVLKINFLDYSETLKGWQDSDIELSELEVIEFLCKTINLKATRFESDLFKYYYQQGWFVLMFDGFDEISPIYESIARRLLQFLANTKVKRIFITTRLYGAVELLEADFNTIAYHLLPLSRKWQMKALQSYWNANEGNDAEGWYWKNYSKTMKSFLSIPLHLWLVAQVASCKEIEPRSKKDLYSVYEDLFRMKFDAIRFGEKAPGMTGAHPEAVDYREKELKDCLEKHKKLSIYTLFHDDEEILHYFIKDISQIRAWIVGIQEGKEKTGIIDQIVMGDQTDMGVPRFAHRTFAEYFAVELIYDELTKDNLHQDQLQKFSRLLINKLCTSELQGIRRFFDRKINNNEFEKALMKETRRKIFVNLILKQEKGEKNMLYLSVKDGHITTLAFFLSCIKVDTGTLTSLITSGEDKSLIAAAVQYEQWDILELFLDYIRTDGSILLDIVAPLEGAFSLLLFGIKQRCDKFVNFLLKDLSSEGRVIMNRLYDCVARKPTTYFSYTDDLNAIKGISFIFGYYDVRATETELCEVLEKKGELVDVEFERFQEDIHKNGRIESRTFVYPRWKVNPWKNIVAPALSTDRPRDAYSKPLFIKEIKRIDKFLKRERFLE